MYVSIENNCLFETHYLHANQLYNAEYYEEAYSIYKTIKNYKDVQKIITEDANILAVGIVYHLQAYALSRRRGNVSNSYQICG